MTLPPSIANFANAKNTAKNLRRAAFEINKGFKQKNKLGNLALPSINADRYTNAIISAAAISGKATINSELERAGFKVKQSVSVVAFGKAALGDIADVAIQIGLNKAEIKAPINVPGVALGLSTTDGITIDAPLVQTSISTPFDFRGTGRFASTISPVKVSIKTEVLQGINENAPDFTTRDKFEVSFDRQPLEVGVQLSITSKFYSKESLVQNFIDDKLFGANGFFTKQSQSDPSKTKYRAIKCIC